MHDDGDPCFSKRMCVVVRGVLSSVVLLRVSILTSVIIFNHTENTSVNTPKFLDSSKSIQSRQKSFRLLGPVDCHRVLRKMSDFVEKEEEEESFHDCAEPPSADEDADSSPQTDIIEVERDTKENEEDVDANEPNGEPAVIREEVPKDITKALEAKEKGNEAFKSRDFDLAIQYYSLAISLCPDDQQEHLATLYGNRSASYYAEEEFDLVVEDCSAALERKPDYLKVLARRMQVYEKLEKYEEALAGMSWYRYSFTLPFSQFCPISLDAKKVKELDPAYPKIVSIM